MGSDRAIEIVQSLVNGIDPYSGEQFQSPSPHKPADGIAIYTSYDALQRPTLTTRTGHESQPDIFTETHYDAAGHVVSRQTLAGSLRQATSNAYDSAGALVWSCGPDGVETRYVYSDDRLTTTQMHGGITNTTVNLPGGQTHYTSQNGVRQQTYTYGVNPDGTQWTTVFTGPEGTNSVQWQTSIIDHLGHTVAEMRPGFGGSILITSNIYNNVGQLCETRTFCDSQLLSRTLYAYDAFGEMFRTCQDQNLNGNMDLSQSDRISESYTSYQFLDSQWWQVHTSLTYPYSDSAIPFTNSISRTRLTGLGTPWSADGANGLLTAEASTTDHLGNTTFSRTVTDRDSKTQYRLTTSPGSTVASLTTTINGFQVASRSKSGHITTYSYDALGRQIASQDARDAVHSRGYDEAGRVTWESDPANHTTHFVYDAYGRRVAVTNALGEVTHSAYDLEGRLIATWGNTYPVAYEYDTLGRMVAMATTRDNEVDFAALAVELANGASLTSLAVAWSLDLTQWRYDAATGLLIQKLYADGKGTAYTYTPDGKLAIRTWARGVTTAYNYDTAGNLVAINYSDNTPNVSFSYDRLGRQLSAIVDGVSTNLYTYDHETLMLVTENQNGMLINRASDTFGRPVGFTMGQDYGVTYAYDEFGRFASVSSSASLANLAVQYSYLAGTDIIAGYTSGDFTRTVSYEPTRSLITAVENKFGNATISQCDYVNDELGRRTAIARSGTAFGDTPVTDSYGYNLRSEVTSARRTLTADPAQPLPGFTHDYVYDPIGNRIVATNNQEAIAYAANSLNQYTAVNETEQVYDDDGNLLSDGRFNYTWNGENRLVVASNNMHVVRYAYDHQGRMVRKQVAENNALTKTITYIWDDFNIIVEKVSNASVTKTTYNIWGLDLSQSLQGAGGVGGLLAIVKDGESFVATYDANGNITEYLSSGGTIAAHYEYSPFGEIAVQSGALADSCTYRFSTKPWCAITGFSEYEYRKYSPDMGRWLSRDSIGERGGINTYVFVQNRSIYYIDRMGLNEAIYPEPDYYEVSGPYNRLAVALGKFGNWGKAFGKYVTEPIGETYIACTPVPDTSCGKKCPYRYDCKADGRVRFFVVNLRIELPKWTGY